MSAGNVSGHREAVQNTRHHPNPSSGGDVNASLPPGAVPGSICCSPAPSRLIIAAARCWLLAVGCGLWAAGWLLRCGLAGPAQCWVVQPGPEPQPANLLQVACRPLPCRRFNHQARAASRSPVQNKNWRGSLDPWPFLPAPAGPRRTGPPTTTRQHAPARSSSQQTPGRPHRRPNGRDMRPCRLMPMGNRQRCETPRDREGTGGLSSCRHATAPMPSVWVWWPWDGGGGGGCGGGGGGGDGGLVVLFVAPCRDSAMPSCHPGEGPPSSSSIAP